MSEIISYRFDVNEKQNRFHDMVMMAAAKLPGYEYRYFFLGGGIRGGKTFGCLFVFHQLAKKYPGSRWYVIREDNPALESTSIPSMEKLIGKEGEGFAWKRGKGNVQVVYKNGSRIIFKSENLQKDKDLNEFLGLEMNGCLLEQMEGLSKTLYDRVIERLGSWYIDPMPIPILLGTFNPTPNWVKKEIYDKYVKGELQKPYFYQPALPSDNTLVTQDQWNNWKNLPPENQMIMIEGIWVFKVDGNTWAHRFDHKKTVVSRNDPRMKIDNRYPIILIFDFNVDPMTCLVAQYSGKDMAWGRILREYRLLSSDIFEMCNQIKTDFPPTYYYLIVTGDPSGRNRDGNSRGKKSYVDNIMTELNLSARQNQFPHSHPSIENTRILVNALFYSHPEFLISDECVFLIEDLNTIKTDEYGKIDKKKIDPKKTHLFDNLRYFSWNYFRRYLKMFDKEKN